jgi:hypothetical protein
MARLTSHAGFLEIPDKDRQSRMTLNRSVVCDLCEKKG